MFRGFLYIIANEATKRENKYKLGCTIYPVCRLYTYLTGDAPGHEHRYVSLWKVSANNRQELLAFEKFLHKRFHRQRLRRQHGGMTEWFEVELEQIISFMAEQPFVELQLSHEEIQDYNTQARSPPKDRSTLKEEKNLMEEQEEELLEEVDESPFTLEQKFLQTFLPGKDFRRIQKELWEIIETMCKRDDIVREKGIVQWPTGVGKTMAVLILIVLMSDWCKRNGKIYRGLFIIPKNDIYDTINKDFSKLSEFGITICDGTHGELSSLKIPLDKPVLVVCCHQALVVNEQINKLPELNHIHYDEVHRITGELLFGLITSHIEVWNTPFITGTSATPQTCSPNQRKKLSDLFGDPLTILHRCEVEEAVREGWIAKPRFIVRILPKLKDRIAIAHAFVDILIPIILKKNIDGKCILYIESSLEEVEVAYLYALETYSDQVVCFTAVDGLRNDEEFVKEIPEGKPYVLFACQRYREGSDIRALELTAKLAGKTTMAHTLVQISGRALRADYEDKEGWCVIVRPSEEGTTEEDVLDSIILDIIDFVNKSDSPLEPKEVEKLARTYFGTLEVSGNERTVEETVQRVQAAYVRRVFITSKTTKERYTFIQAHNRILGIMSKNEYEESATKHPKYIPEPKVYFKDNWTSWYDFLGVDTSSFPQTKTEWICLCKERGILTWSNYKKNTYSDLPGNPGEMYEDYSNWDKEFGVDDEIVW
jgi:superfamily II DNA or RNA helicase